MSKMITTSNTKIRPIKKEGIREVVEEDQVRGGKVATLVSDKALKTITTSHVRPKTRLDGPPAPPNYYGPLRTDQFKSFPETAKDRKARERVYEEEADKKRVADGVSPVLKKRGTRKSK